MPINILFIHDCACVSQTLAGALNRKGHSAYTISAFEPRMICRSLGADSVILARGRPTDRYKLGPTAISVLTNGKIELRRIDVVDTNNTSAWLIGELLKDILRTRHIITLHGTDLRNLIGLHYVSDSSPTSSLKKGLLIQLLRRADLLLATTPDLLTYAQVLGRKIFHLPQPIDTTSFNEQIARNKQLIGDPIVFCPTSLRAVKGGQTMVQLLKRLVTRYPHSHIYQVRSGEPKLLDALETIPSRNLTMVEPIPHHLMPSWYVSSDVVLGQAALGILSLVEIEAMSCGVPVVVYDKYYDYGYKTKGIESAWSMLEEILSDTEFRRKLIQKGKKIVQEEHEAGHVADLYIKYLDSIRIHSI